MPAIAAMMYPYACLRQRRIPPAASAVIMIVMSSDATSLKASVLIGVGLPAKAYAVQIAIHAAVKATAINVR